MKGREFEDFIQRWNMIACLLSHKISEFKSVEILGNCYITNNISCAGYRFIRNMSICQVPYLPK